MEQQPDASSNLSRPILPAMEFLREWVIAGLIDLQKAGFHYYSFIVMAQAVEVLGAFLDEKPFRAKEQARARFQKAMRVLFPPPYARLNEGDGLYHKLRNHLAHFLVPSSELILTTREALQPGQVHLGVWEGRTVLVAEDFLHDLVRATNMIIRKLEEGKIREKGFPRFAFGR